MRREQQNKLKKMKDVPEVKNRPQEMPESKGSMMQRQELTLLVDGRSLSLGVLYDDRQPVSMITHQAAE